MDRDELQLLALNVLSKKPEKFFLIQSSEEFFLAWSGGSFSGLQTAAVEKPRVNYRSFNPDAASIHDFEPDFFIHKKKNLNTNLKDEAICEMKKMAAPAGMTPEFLSKEFIPSKEQWLDYCRKIEHEIKTGVLQKVVPARSKKIKCKQAVSFVWALATLFKKLTPLQGLHLFCLHHNDNLFLGASPELLVECEGARVFIPAIAGTRKRNLENEVVDNELANSLLESTKEMAEHRFVVKYITEQLSSISQIKLDLNKIPSPQILKLSTLQHLFTPVRAEFAPGVFVSEKILSLVSKLHPTPAVCGYPGVEAMHFIQKNEGWNRALFSSPLGFYTAQDAKFVVGIRSALISENTISFFAGAGYVNGSFAENEWEETEQKMHFLEEVFAVHT